MGQLSTSPVFKPPYLAILRRWLDASKDFHALATAFLRVVHPALYNTATDVMKTLSTQEVIRPHITEWGLPFTAVSLICNRETIQHRDLKTGETMYDLLVSVGPYGSTELEITQANLRVDYKPGTMVALTGRLLLHGVPRCNGSRLCQAYYFREHVFQRCRVMDPGFMTQERYRDYIHRPAEYLGRDLYVSP